MEQELYASEGIDIPGTAFVDNEPALDLVEAKVTGILSMTDEEINVRGGSDENLSKKFGVLYYVVTNFLEKNKDQLHAILQASQSPFITKFFPEDDSPATTHARSRGSVKPTQASYFSKKTLGFQFKTQLNELQSSITTLNSTFPHFVRCMKFFLESSVLNQSDR